MESPVQTVELKAILQEKEVLQTKLQNTKAIVGTIRDEKAALEDQIKNLNEKFDNMTIVDASISLALESGSLSFKELELKNTQEELVETKKILADKVKVLRKTSTENENLRKQVEAGKQALRDTKFLLWDHMFKEIKKLKDHLLKLQDERALIGTCLSNVDLVQEMMGDKPTQAQKAVNFLNSQSKMQLQFSGIQDRAELIVHAKKYIVKETLANEVLMKEKFLKARIDQFRHAFKYLFDNGLLSFWNEEGIMISESNYLSLWQPKKNDTSSINQLDPIIKGNHIYDVLDRDFCLYHEARRIISNLPPHSYYLYFDLDVVNRDLLAVAFPPSSVWQRIAQFASKWNVSES